MLWKRWTQSIRKWSYTLLCTIFTGLWFAVTLRWVSSSARLRNSFEHWGWGHSKVPLISSILSQCLVVLSISRAEIAKNGFSPLRQVASFGQNMMSFHAISLPAPILKAFHIRSPPGVNSELYSALKLGVFFNFRDIFLSFMQNTPAVVPRTGLSFRAVCISWAVKISRPSLQ